MSRKYPITNGYYVYSHSIDGMVYFGVSKQQPSIRWQKASYKTTALKPYLNRFYEWKHKIIQDGLTKEQAYELEDWYISNTPNCINNKRSGFVCSDMKQYMKQYIKQYYQEHKEEIKEYYQNNRQKRLEYYQEHKEERKQYQKNYYQQHKEEKKEYQKQYQKQYYQEHKKRA